MKITTLTSFFVLLSVVSMVAIVPSAFADHTSATVTNALGSSTPGCEDTNSCFDPNPVTIAMGGTVTWENVDNAAHTVTSGSPADGPDGVFDSSLIMAPMQGVVKTFSHTFDDAGTYDYFCMVHPWMAGSVIVADAAAAEAEAAETAEAEGKRQIIPRKAVLELAKILREENDNINLSFGNSSLRIKDINLDFSTKLIDGKFPDYEKVLPSGEPDALEISKENLQSALTRASILSNEKYRGVRFELSKNKLKLTANNPEKESAEELLEVNYEGSPMEIGFNIGYLLDVLATIESETVEINFYGEESSCLIREPGNKLEAYVIMPMRL